MTVREPLVQRVHLMYPVPLHSLHVLVSPFSVYVFAHAICPSLQSHFSNVVISPAGPPSG